MFLRVAVCASTSEEANIQLVQLVAHHSLSYSWQHIANQERKFKISLIFPHKIFRIIVACQV
jgi:hypothetical protein